MTSQPAPQNQQIQKECLFSMLDQENIGKIHVDRINDIASQFNELKENAEKKKAEALQKQDQAKKQNKGVIQPKSRRVSSQNYSKNTISSQNSAKVTKVNPKYNRENQKGWEQQQQQLNEKADQFTNGSKQHATIEEKEEEKIKPLKNRFSKFGGIINLDNFSQIHDQTFKNKQLKPETLEKCFKMMDYEGQNALSLDNIKQIFSIFNEKITDEEIKDFFKFNGCSDNKMNFEKFQEFTKGNI